MLPDLILALRSASIWSIATSDFESTHGFGNVPDLLFAKIRKCNWMLAQVFTHTAGHANSSGRFIECFQPRSDIDAISKNIAVLHHHVADINSNTQNDSRFASLSSAFSSASKT